LFWIAEHINLNETKLGGVVEPVVFADRIDGTGSGAPTGLDVLETTVDHFPV
tara:strand:- start:554 stop:709 length:156 start_codon:yes stop_codon:yes gene_type:complete